MMDNYPPGIRECDIPGNTSWDVACDDTREYLRMHPHVFEEICITEADDCDYWDDTYGKCRRNIGHDSQNVLDCPYCYDMAVERWEEL
jgi:uncharacterized Zn-finger protein